MLNAQIMSQQSLQWMIQVGVDQEDVEWLALMNGSLELHTAPCRARVERIYTTAMMGVLESPSPMEVIRSIQLN